MLGCGNAGAAQEEAVHGLRRYAVRLLREVADGCVRGSGDDVARVRSGEAGEQPEQGRLARAVGADEADHIARGDDEIEVAEQHAVGVAGGEPLGDQRGAHERTRLAGRRGVGTLRALPIRPIVGPKSGLCRCGPPPSALPRLGPGAPLTSGRADVTWGGTWMFRACCSPLARFWS